MSDFTCAAPVLDTNVVITWCSVLAPNWEASFCQSLINSMTSNYWSYCRSIFHSHFDFFNVCYCMGHWVSAALAHKMCGVILVGVPVSQIFIAAGVEWSGRSSVYMQPLPIHCIGIKHSCRHFIVVCICCEVQVDINPCLILFWLWLISAKWTFLSGILNLKTSDFRTLFPKDWNKYHSVFWS